MLDNTYLTPRQLGEPIYNIDKNCPIVAKTLEILSKPLLDVHNWKVYTSDGDKSGLLKDYCIVYTGELYNRKKLSIKFRTIQDATKAVNKLPNYFCFKFEEEICFIGLLCSDNGNYKDLYLREKLYPLISYICGMNQGGRSHVSNRLNSLVDMVGI